MKANLYNSTPKYVFHQQNETILLFCKKKSNRKGQQTKVQHLNNLQNKIEQYIYLFKQHVFKCVRTINLEKPTMNIRRNKQNVPPQNRMDGGHKKFVQPI